MVLDQSAESDLWRRCRRARRIARRSSCPRTTSLASAPCVASVARCLRLAMGCPDDAVAAHTGATAAGSLGGWGKGRGQVEPRRPPIAIGLAGALKPPLKRSTGASRGDDRRGGAGARKDHIRDEPVELGRTVLRHLV